MRFRMISLLALSFLASGTWHQGLQAVEQTTAPLEANKEIARRWMAALEGGDLATLQALRGPSITAHGPTGSRVNSGPSTCPMCAAMKDLKITIDVIVAERDLVTVRSTWTGLFFGPFGSLAVAEPRPLQIYYTNIYRIADGHVVENWLVSDGLALAEQLGYSLTPTGNRER